MRVFLSGFLQAAFFYFLAVMPVIVFDRLAVSRKKEENETKN